jgi:ATP-dependent Lon protease
LIEEQADQVEYDIRERLITQHIKLVELGDRTLQPKQFQILAHISYFLAQNSWLSLLQKQALLELPGENQRIAFLVEHLETFIPQVEQVEELRRKIRSNGHMREAE